VNIILAMIGILHVELMEATSEMIHGVGVHLPARINMIWGGIPLGSHRHLLLVSIAIINNAKNSCLNLLWQWEAHKVPKDATHLARGIPW
jgi:hypothetical protein